MAIQSCSAGREPFPSMPCCFHDSPQTRAIDWPRASALWDGHGLYGIRPAVAFGQRYTSPVRHHHGPRLDRRGRRCNRPAPAKGEVAGGPPVLDLAMVAIGLIAVGDYRAVWVKTDGDG